MRPGVEGRECLFDLCHTIHHLYRVVAEREVDRDGVLEGEGERKRERGESGERARHTHRQRVRHTQRQQRRETPVKQRTEETHLRGRRHESRITGDLPEL